MTRRHPLLAGAIVAALSLQPSAQAQSAKPLTWAACEAGAFDQDWSGFGNRIQCATMDAPLDHAVPDGERISVGLIRIRASQPDQREGSLFFNFGGPGANPRTLLPYMAWIWDNIHRDDPIRGEQKLIAERYDLVAVVPRGLKGGTTFNCLVGHVSTPFNLIASDTGEDNWEAAREEAMARGTVCSSQPLARYVDTGQHVRDMDLARRLLGERKLHFFGASYGTWVGAWYGAVFPENTGRMLFDSTMDFTGTFADAINDQAIERHRSFMRTVVLPALAAPDRYGIGTNEDDVLDRMRAMPQKAKERWATNLGSPSDLAAALVMSEWLSIDPSMEESDLTRRVKAHVFGNDLATNRLITGAAQDLIEAYNDPHPLDIEEEAIKSFGNEFVSVNLAVQCSDTLWNASSAFWLDRARTNAYNYPGGSTNEVLPGLICSHWKGVVGTQPSLAPLREVPPVLMIQAEYDPATSLTGATRVQTAYANMHLVVARDMTGHGILGSSATPCVEKAAGHYLLTGETPSEKYSDCAFVPTPRSRSLDPDGACTEQAGGEYATEGPNGDGYSACGIVYGTEESDAGNEAETARLRARFTRLLRHS